MTEEIRKPKKKFKLLSEEYIDLQYTTAKETVSHDSVPPHTPNSEFFYQNDIPSLPMFPDVDSLNIPLIRDTGVKFGIETLGQYFKLTNYKYNLLEFWILDILTDCLWTAQDEFHLPYDLQKVILAWVLYFINLIKDPSKNINRSEFFVIFKEAILIAAEVVDEGCDTVPLPKQVFSIIQKEKEANHWSSDSKTTTSSIKLLKEDFDCPSYIEITNNDEERRFPLPKEVCTCEKYDLSSVDSKTETDSLPRFSDIISQVGIEEELSDVEFYKSDSRTPPRFLSQAEESSTSTEKIINKPLCYINPEEMRKDGEEGTTEDIPVVEVSEKLTIKVESTAVSESIESTSIPSNQNHNELILNVEANTEQLIKQMTDEEVIEKLAINKMWEQRKKDMENPEVGWLPYDTDVKPTNVTEETSQYDGDDEWIDIIIGKQRDIIDQTESKLVINFGVLWAITDFIFKYFYESFQFSLIKLAFQATPGIITQTLNKEWLIPKRFKGDLKKPKPKKPKKPKKPPKEKPKKEPKPKEKPAKKSPKEKPEKKPKPVKLTKEQMAELKRQQMEQARLEQELLKIEENKRFMFPLMEAAEDELFKGIFENWVKPKAAKASTKSSKKK